MKQLFVKKAMGVFLTVAEDPNDPTVAGPMPWARAATSLTLGLPVLGRTVQEKGAFDAAVVGVLMSYGALAVAALLHHAPMLGECDRIDATRRLTQHLADTVPSIPYLVQREWLTIDPAFGPYHQLVGDVLGARALLLKLPAEEAAGHSEAMEACMLALLNTIIAWCWEIGVRLGEETPETPDDAAVQPA